MGDAERNRRRRARGLRRRGRADAPGRRAPSSRGRPGPPRRRGGARGAGRGVCGGGGVRKGRGNAGRSDRHLLAAKLHGEWHAGDGHCQGKGTLRIDVPGAESPQRRRARARGGRGDARPPCGRRARRRARAGRGDAGRQGRGARPRRGRPAVRRRLARGELRHAPLTRPRGRRVGSCCARAVDIDGTYVAARPATECSKRPRRAAAPARVALSACASMCAQL
mmetsp:Transcript_6947/g.28463  ORF Transcript_6947/g.28463 Transcript_6947/m.28463 type:complete len:223 (+) Transcript_6947:237-905(+)